METLGVTSLSKSHVSEMAKDLDEMDADFRDRPLDAGPYTYVWADALTMKVRGRIVNIACLLAVGVNSEGYREILGLDLATTENGAAGSPSSVPRRPWTLWSAAGDLRRPHRPAVSTVIPGMRSPAHVGQNCAVSDGRLLVSEVLEKLRDHSWPRNFYADAW